MKITLYIRRHKTMPTHFTMRTDTTAERDDSPRIHNLGVEIKEAIDRIIEKCEKESVVRVGKVGQ